MSSLDDCNNISLSDLSIICLIFIIIIIALLPRKLKIWSPSHKISDGLIYYIYKTHGVRRHGALDYVI